MDQLFAAVGSDKALVFRRSFQSRKWENVATENRTSKVQFLKRSGNYVFRVIPEDGKTAVSIHIYLNWLTAVHFLD